MRRIKPHAEGHDHNLERWLLTYADMITLLTAFFLMLYSMSVMSRGKFSMLATSVRSGFGGMVQGGPSILQGGGAHTTQIGISPEASYERYEQAVRNLSHYVEQKHLSSKVNMRSDERGVIISLVSDNMLFERGKAQLRPGSTSVLAQVAHVLKSVPNTILIEGHTCDLPIHTAQFPSNWELSTARAGTVLRYFTEQMGLPNQRFTAAGYAETHPLVPNTSEANRARNRRVDIVILKTEAQQEADMQRQAEIRRITAEKAENADKAARGATSGTTAAPAAKKPSQEPAQAAPSPAGNTEGAGGATGGDTTVEP